MNRAAHDAVIYNFGSGPAGLPAPVMERAREEFPNFAGTGLSVVEISHRSKEFSDVVAQAEADARALMDLGDDYAVLFLQGGATLQFLMIALNLAVPGQHTAYLDTGYWSRKAIKVAQEVRPVDVVASAAEGGYTAVPPQASWQRFDNAAYLHYTPNETIDGLEFGFVPDTGDVPLVADMSSTILSRPFPVERFGLIYAGAQKNLGPAGLAMIILRRDLAERVSADVPGQLRFRDQIAAGSLLNTPPTFTWWLVGMTLAWVREQGGVEEMDRRARERSRIVYDAIDGSGGFYTNDVNQAERSRTNIPFRLGDASLEARFLEESAAAGLKQLAGHRSKGGLRASMYNAMPLAGANALAEFMGDFLRRNG